MRWWLAKWNICWTSAIYIQLIHSGLADMPRAFLLLPYWQNVGSDNVIDAYRRRFFRKLIQLKKIPNFFMLFPARKVDGLLKI